MPRICFKRRAGGNTVQLVKHVYTPTAKRTCTITVGTLRLDADPDNLPIRLRTDPGLSAAEVEAVRLWLTQNGDPIAAARRREEAQRLEMQIRERLAQEQTLTSSPEPFEAAAKALNAAALALSERAAELRTRGEIPWDTLRKPYLGIYEAWRELVDMAQAQGVAKKSTRKANTSLT
jgi:hypothetical protein